MGVARKEGGVRYRQGGAGCRCGQGNDWLALLICHLPPSTTVRLEGAAQRDHNAEEMRPTGVWQ